MPWYLVQPHLCDDVLSWNGAHLSCFAWDGICDTSVSQIVHLERNLQLRSIPIAANENIRGWRVAIDGINDEYYW